MKKLFIITLEVISNQKIQLFSKFVLADWLVVQKVVQILALKLAII
jgi:hypothetical protein